MPDPGQMTPDEVERITRVAVEETLTRMGFDVKSPLDAQKDAAYLRNLRLGNEALKRHGALVIIGAVITAVTTMLWIGFKGLMNPTGGSP